MRMFASGVEPGPDGPDVPRFERRLRADELASIPGDASTSLN